MATNFHCTLTTPDSEVFDREVTYVQLPAHDGQIGIQAGRAPLLVKLGYGLLRLTDNAGQHTSMMVGGGFAQVKGSDLAIVTDEACELDSFTLEDAQKALAKANDQSAATEAEQARKQRDTDRAWAMVNLAKG